MYLLQVALAQVSVIWHLLLDTRHAYFVFKVYYTNTAKLLSILKMAKADGFHLKELNCLEKHDLLILDDFGI